MKLFEKVLDFLLLSNMEKIFYSTCIKESKIFGLEIGKKYKSEMDHRGDIRVFLPIYAKNDNFGRNYRWFVGGFYTEYFENASEIRKLKLKFKIF